MNNIEQKKIRAWTSPVRRMPYGDAGHVQYEYDEDNDARIDAQSFNNLLQQLVDNDIYVENRLNAVTGYHAGPKSSTETAVAAGYDGYKFWGYSQNGDPIVYRKNELPLSDILSAVYSQPDDISCENIFEFAGVYYACTGSRLLSSSTGYSGWAQAFDDGRYWAATQSNGTTVVMRGDEACLLYIKRVGAEETVQLTALHRFENPTAVALRSDGRLFVASGKRLSSMTLAGVTVQDVVFECAADSDINGISFTDDGKTIVLATNDGVYTSEEIDSLAGLDVIDAGAHVNMIAATDSAVYFATDDGLRTGAACRPVDGTEGCEIKYAVSVMDALYYCSSSGKKTGVFKFGDANPVYGITEHVKWFGWYKDDVLFVETDSGLAYYTSSGSQYDVLPHSGDGAKLLLTRQDEQGRAALYHASQTGDDVTLSSFSVAGTERRKDTFVASADKNPYTVGGKLINEPVVAVLDVSGKTFAVTRSDGIFDIADLEQVGQFVHSDVFKAVTDGKMIITASKTSVYRTDPGGASYKIDLPDGSEIRSIQYCKGALAVVTDKGFCIIYDDGNRPPVEFTEATGVKDAVLFADEVYVLKNDGKVVKYGMRPAPFQQYVPAEPVPAFLSDEILQAGFVGRKQTPSTYGVYDIALLTRSGLSTAECSVVFEDDDSTKISEPGLIFEGSFNCFRRDGDIALLAGATGVSAFVDDSQIPGPGLEFMRSADALALPGGVNDIAKYGENYRSCSYIAATDNGVSAFEVGRQSPEQIQNVHGACMFSGLLAYVVQEGGSSKLYIKDGDEELAVISDLPSDARIKYGFKADSYASNKDFSRIVVGAAEKAFYIDRYYNGTPTKCGEIKFSSGLAFVHAAPVQKDDTTIVVFATDGGKLYSCLSGQLFGTPNSTGVLQPTVALLIDTGKPILYLDTLYSDDESGNINVCAVYDNGEIRVFPVKNVTSSSCLNTASSRTVTLSLSGSDKLCNAHFIGDYVYFDTGKQTIQYANINDNTPSIRSLDTSRDIAIINDGIIVGTDHAAVYTVQIAEDGPKSKLDLVESRTYQDNVRAGTTHVFDGVGTVAGNTLYLMQDWEITPLKYVEFAGGADAVAFSPVKNTLFVASGGKVFCKTGVNGSEDIDSSIIKQDPIVEFEGETVERFVPAGDAVVAVYSHHIVEFEYDGTSWQAAPSPKFDESQTFHGIFDTGYDDQSDIFSEYKYLTDKGMVDSEIIGYRTRIIDSNVCKADAILSFDDKFFVFDDRKLYRLSDGSFVEEAVPAVDGARDIVLTGAGSRYSGYIRKESESVYFKNGTVVTSIPFRVEGGSFISFDKHLVGTADAGLIVLGYAEALCPKIESVVEKTVQNYTLAGLYGYRNGQNALIAAQNSSGFLNYFRYDRSGSYTSERHASDANIWIPQGMEQSSRNFQALAKSGKFWLYQNDAPYRDLTDLVRSRNIDPSELNGFWKFGSAYYIAFGDKTMSFTGFRNGLAFSQSGDVAGKSFERIENIGNDMFVMTPKTAGGVFVYDMGSGFGYQAGFYDAVGSFCKYFENGAAAYMISNGDRLLTSDNLRSWREYAKLPGEGAGPAAAIVKTGRNQFVFATGKALYASKYQYETPRDTYMMTEQDAWRIYEDANAQVEAGLSGSVDGHLSAMHQDSSRAAQFAGRATVQFDIGLTGDAETPEEISSQAYDYVKKFYQGNTDNDADRTIRARMRSGFTSKDADDPAGWRELKCNWIARPYYSGVIDFDVCVHTTNTYYIPHISGAGNVGGDPELPRTRRNLIGRDVISSSCNSTIRDNYTTVEIGFLSNVFNVDDVMSMTVQGNSLPKKIFIDYANENGNVEGAAYEMYSSFAEPSLADQGSIDQVKGEDGYRWFRFYCFGTDQQAFRMTAFDSKRNYDKDLYKIVLNSKGRPDAYGNIVVQQTLLEGDTVSLWPASRFAGQDEIFMGWTTSNYQGSAPDSNSDLIPDGQVVDASFIMMRSGGSRTLNLYAVWFKLEFDDESTVIGVESDGRPFGIARVEADPRALPNLGSKIAVKIGD